MKKIRYSKVRLRSNIKMGLFFTSTGITLVLLSFVIGEWKEIPIQSVGVGQFGAGIFMFIQYYIENRKQYLKIENGELTKNTLYPKKIKLNQIKSISEFAGDLKLITDENEFVIDTQIIEPHSLVELKNELNKYNLR